MHVTDDLCVHYSIRGVLRDSHKAGKTSMEESQRRSVEANSHAVRETKIPQQVR